MGNARNIQERLIQRQGLDDGRKFLHYLVDDMRNLLVASHIGIHVDTVRTQFFSPRNGHGRMDAKLSGFIGCSGHNATRRKTTHNNGVAFVFRMIQLFYGCKEGIHINMHNPASHDYASFSCSSRRQYLICAQIHSSFVLYNCGMISKMSPNVSSLME